MKNSVLKIICLFLIFIIIALLVAIYIELTEDSASQPVASIGNVTYINGMQNPVELFDAVAASAKRDDYVTASSIYMVAMAYSEFDRRRVSDTSAHQITRILLLRSSSELNQDQVEALQNAITVAQSDSEGAVRRLRAVGPPQYYPSYMIDHGMSAILNGTGTDNLNEGFDSEATWIEMLAELGTPR